MKRKIITISRQFGSGGRTIGKKLANRLGYAYYDKEIIEQVHEKTGFSKEFIEDQGEYSPTKSLFSYAFVGRDVNGISVNDHIYNAQRKVILEIAAKDEPCVIVGRCADYILKDSEDTFNIFIHASKEFRANRVLEEYGESNESIDKRLKDKDRKRRINYKYYTDREWGVCTNYDISLDTGRLGIDRCVDILERLIREENQLTVDNEDYKI